MRGGWVVIEGSGGSSRSVELGVGLAPPFINSAGLAANACVHYRRRRRRRRSSRRRVRVYRATHARTHALLTRRRGK